MTTDEKINAILARAELALARLDAIDDRMITINANTQRILDALAGGRAAPSGGAHAAPRTSGGASLPNYGRRKGEPIEGCPIADLEYYANGARRSLDDPAKARWHDKERALLAAIEAEIARQRGGGGLVEPASTGGFGDSTNPDDAIPF